MRIKARRYLCERTRRGKKSNRIKRIQYYNKGTDICLLFYIELPRDTVKFKLLKSSVMDNLRIPDSLLQKTANYGSIHLSITALQEQKNVHLSCILYLFWANCAI